MKKTIRYKLNEKALLVMSFLLVMVLAISSCTTDDVQEVATRTNLVMADEFDTDGILNSSLWKFDIGDGSDQGLPGWGNNELQYYTDRPENVTVDNGFLIITALEESFQGSNYTSGRILTKGLFEQQYGRFEARIRLPSGKGMWPAFWMLGSNIDQVGWPQCGEIDIMENAGSQPTIVSSALHGPGYSGGQPVLKKFDFVNDRVDSKFHIYGVEWSPNEVNFYVDDKLYHTATPDDADGEWVFNNGPFYILINLAVGGVFDGNPDEDTVFPQTMVVDYVRVYQ